MFLLAVALAAISSAVALAQPTPEQRAEITRMLTEVRKAGNLYTQGRFRDSGEIVRDVQERLEAMNAKADRLTRVQLGRVHSSLVRAHALLELQGVRLPPLKDLDAGAGLPMPRPEDPQPETPSADGVVSFAKQVAPTLVKHCGGCHVSGNRGGFSMRSFAALMEGAGGARVIVPGQPDDSRLIETIENGEMPKGGGKVPAAELATLKTWVREGAKFDGDNPQLGLPQLIRANRPDAEPAPVVAATGDESVSFARDIAPVLVKSCLGCHGANRPRAGFSAVSFRELLAGGDSGPAVEPGRPGTSLLIQKLKGEVGQRMPLNLPPLPPATIAKFETWIREGARFDGPDPAMPLDRLAALARVAAASHEELSAERAEESQKQWRLGMPGIDAAKSETDNFLVLGNVSAEDADAVSELAEKQAVEVLKLLQAKTDGPMVKGRITLFVFPQRYDYGEFGRMVERRTLPSVWRGHWRFDGVAAYGALIKPRRNPDALPPLVTQQVAGVYLASTAEAPRWFSEGAARAVTARLHPESELVRSWKDGLAEAKSRVTGPADILDGKLAPQDADLASFGLVDALMKDRRWPKLLAKLRDGDPFEPSFEAAFGASPEALAAAWLRSR